ncbi:MAG: PQQ-dependent sugar dehydrogenase [Planctomycetota bacterium]
MTRSALLFPAVAFALAACTPAQDGKPADLLRCVEAFPGQAKFDRPIYLDWSAKDPAHYWVVEQTGKLWRIPRDGAKADRQLVLDLSSTAFHPGNGGHNEEGFLGFAFDPHWGDGNHHVFAYWSHRTGGNARNPTRESVISRFETKADGEAIVADKDSELVVIRIEEPWGNHNGGTIVFGPDGMLYVALGDGGAANDPNGNGQNLGTLLGSILRIDVREATKEKPYAIPQDNPFVGKEGARGEIWAYGLRNPWRISFDDATGELWCGDVGQNLFEEVDHIVKGGNYGWNLMEATHTFPPGAELSEEKRKGLILPITEYPRADGISVTGGYVYRGKESPELVGRFVYGDYALRNLWAVKAGDAKTPADVKKLGVAPAPLASFGRLPDGELVALCHDGRIYRLAAQ